jgi:hypothetical protein
VNEQLRRRRLLWPKSLAGKAGVAAVVLLGILVIAFVAADRYTGQRLEEAWRKGEEFGLPNEVALLFGPYVPDERNLAIPLDEASAIAAAFLEGERKKRPGVAEIEFLDTVEFAAATDAVLNDSRYENALHGAERRTEYRSLGNQRPPYLYASSAFLEPRRDVIRVETRIARQLASRGKVEEAVRRLLRILRLTRHWEDKEPLAIGPMINAAIRCLTIDALNETLRSNGRLPAALHDEVERELALSESAPRINLLMLHTQKLVCMDAYDEVNPLAKYKVLRPVTNHDRAYMLRFFHRMMRTSSMPANEASREFESFERELKRTKGHPLAGPMHCGACLLMPPAFRIREPFNRLVAVSRCLRVVNGWARKGDFQAPLQSLGLPKECLIDPYDGRSLRIKKTAKGPLVYAVGENQKDDEGDVQFMKDVGLAPVETKTMKRIP